MSRVSVLFGSQIRSLFNNCSHNSAVNVAKQKLCTQTVRGENQILAQCRVNTFKQTNHQRSPFLNRPFSTSPNKQAIPPIVWIFFKPITKLGAILAGRGFRKWWAALPQLKRELFKNHLLRNKFRYMGGVGGSSAACFVFYRSHLEETPITKRQRFMLFSTEHLTEIEKVEKEQIFKAYETNILDIYSPYTTRALRVANRIFEANKNTQEVNAVKWQLTVIDADIVNAIAFPSGELAVFTGLLKFVENDDELAIILAHEMSHAILQHAAEEVSRSRLIDIISISLIMVVWAFLPTDITALLTQFLSEKFLKFILELPYSRLLEKEADTVGLMLTAKACFDVRLSPMFWRRMSKLSDEVVPEILSTHPANETRAVDLENLIPAALQLRKDCNCHNLPDHFVIIPSNIKSVLAAAKQAGA